MDDDLLTGIIEDTPVPRRRRAPDDDPNRQALANPRVKAFLDKIGKSEGADYNTLVGGRRINDLSRHPNVVGLRTSAGPSTAFGKYQIVGTTNRSKLAKYKDLDYSPENQDVRAVELLRQTKALEALEQGDETTAMRRAGREWASIPGSTLPGRKNTSAWRQASGSVAQAPQDDLATGIVADDDDDLMSGVVDAPAAPVKVPVSRYGSPRQRPVAPRGRPQSSSPFANVQGGAGVITPNTDTSANRRAPDINQILTEARQRNTERPLTFEQDRVQRIRQRGGKNSRMAEDESMANLKRVRQEVAAEPNRRAETRLFDPKLNDEEEVTRRLGVEKEQADATARANALYERDKPEIDRIAQEYRSALRGAGVAGAAGTKGGGDPAKWAAESIAKGGAGLTEKFAGVVRSSMSPAISAINALVGVDNEKAADLLNLHAQAIQQAAVEEGANRHEASKFAQDIVGGFIATSPELAAMGLGLPAWAAFGGGEGLSAYGGKRDVVPAVAHGVATGGAFGLGAKGKGVKGLLKHAGAVTGATTGIELAAGHTPQEAFTTGLTNAATLGVPGAVKLRRSAVNARKAEAQRQGLQAEQPGAEVKGQPVVPEAPQEYYHTGLKGYFVKAADQKGANKGKTKVYAKGNPEEIHYLKTVDLQGRGNERMVPIKPEPKVEQTEARVPEVVEQAERNQIREELGYPAEVPAGKTAETLPAEGDRSPSTPARVTPLADRFADVTEAPEMQAIRGERDVAEQGERRQRTLAETDPKTGLGNDLALQKALKTKPPEGFVVAFDFDNLTALNDAYGHIKADVKLQAAADALKAEYGQAFRGGKASDEFQSIDTTSKTQAEANAKAQALSDRFRAEHGEKIGDRTTGLTGGVGKDLESADHAAKLAKIAGKQARGEPLKKDEYRLAESAKADQPTKSPQEVIEAAGLEYRGQQPTMPRGTFGEQFQVGPDTLTIKGPVTPETVAAELAKHAAKKGGTPKDAQTAVAAGAEVLSSKGVGGQSATIPAPSKLPSFVEAARAREAAHATRKAEGVEYRGSGGPDTQRMIDQAIIKGWDVYSAAKPKFDDWAREIRKEFGEKVEPHLRKIYSQLSGTPEASIPKAKEGESTTSAKKASMARDRAELDLPELPPAERKSWQTSLDNAKDKGLVDHATTLAREVLDRPRALNDEQTASLVIRAQMVKNRLARVREEMVAAKDPETVQNKASEARALQNEFNEISAATKASGSEKGRNLAAQKLTINQDFDLTSLIQRATEAKERPLTPKEEARYDSIVKERDAAIVDRDKALEQLHAKRLQGELDKASRVRTREAKKESLDKEAVMIKENIAAEFARLKSSQSGTFSMGGLGNLDPNGVITKNLLKYAKNRAEATIGLKAEALIDDAHSLVKDFGITRRQVAEALSGYGKSPVDKRSEAARNLAAVRAEITALLKADDIEAGKLSPRAEGPKTSEARQSGVPLQGPKLSDVRKVPAPGPRMSEAARSGQPLEGPKPSDARKLKAEGPKLSESTERMPGPKYDLARNQKRLNDLRKQEAEWERKFNEREFEPRPTAEPYPYSPEVRKAEDRVRIAEAKFNREMLREMPGHQFRNASGIIKSWLLSGPPTQIMNVAGTGSYQAFREAARLPAAIADAAVSTMTGQRSITGPSPSAMLDSVLHAGKVGGREFMETMRHGATKEQMERHQYQEIDFGVNTGKKVIDSSVKLIELAHNAVFRLMSGTDRIFYQQAYRRNLVDRATVQAKNEGVSDVKSRTRELIEKPGEQLDADAKHDALVSTFNNSNWLSSKIKRARSAVVSKESLMSRKNAQRLNAAENLALDFILPFDRTPTNVVSRIIEASPLGFGKNVGQLVAAAMRKSMPVEHQRQMAQTFGNATTGTALMALGWYLGDKMIDVEGYDVFLKIPGLPKINLRTISPIGSIVAVGAKLKQAHKDPKSSWGDYAKPALDVPASIPILKATTPLVDIAKDPERGLTKSGGRFASMLVPFGGLSKWVAEATDRQENGQPTSNPFKGEAVPRKSESFMDALKIKVPGARQTVKKDRKKMKTPSKYPTVRPGAVNVGRANVGARP